MSTSAQANAWNKAHPERHRELSREYRMRHPEDRWHRELRHKALEVLGSRCCQCGFDDWRALEIDHINNDGSRDRQKRHRNKMLNDIINGIARERFQLLCANCHQIKSYEEVWKHSTGRRKVAA